MKAAIYLRDSSEMQRVQGTSIEAQRKSCVEYSERVGHKVVAEYLDDGFSGRSIDRRQFQAMLAEVRSTPRPFDVIVLYDTSRFDRSKEGPTELIKLRHLGIRVEYVVLPLNYEDDGELTPESELTEDQIKSLDRYFSRKLGRDVLRGCKTVASKGHWTGGSPPFGYRAVKKTDGDSPYFALEPDLDAAPIVQKIFELKADGLGDRKIRDYLDCEGIKPPRRGKRTTIPSISGGVKGQVTEGGWHEGTVRAIILNRAYVGELSYNKRRWKRSIETGRRIPRLKAAGQWITVKDAHPPIIDQALFEAANAMRDRCKPQTRKSSQRVYLLTGLVACAACGKAAHAKTAVKKGRRTRYYYVCQSRKLRTCLTPHVDADALERSVLDNVVKVLGEIDIEKVEADLFRGADPETPALTSQRARLETKRANALRAIEDGIFEMAPRLRELTTQVADIDKRLLELKQARLQPMGPKAFKEAVRSISDQLGVDESRADLRSALRCLIPPGGLEVDFKNETASMRVRYRAMYAAKEQGLREVHCGGWI